MHVLFSQRRSGLRAVAWCFLLLAISATACLAGNTDDLLVIVQNGKYGYIDHQGKVVIQPQYMQAYNFSGGLGVVYACGRDVAINASGELSPLKIAEEGELAEQKAGDKTGFVDSQGAFKIPPTFEDAMPFSEGLASVRINDKWGFIDTSGKLLIQPQFDVGTIFREGVAAVKLNSVHILINPKGETIASGYEDLDVFAADGLIAASLNRKWGYLDLQGGVAIPFVYDGARTFSGRFATVEKGEKWGYVDQKGEVVIPIEFDEAWDFGSGLAPAKIGTHSGFIDKTGKFVIDLDYSAADGFRDGSDVSTFWTEDNEFGYVNKAGKVIWGPTEEQPTHSPIFGWSDDDKARSCENIPESVKARILAFPPQ